MKNELLEKIKQEVAKPNGFEDFNALLCDGYDTPDGIMLLDAVISEIAHRYAQAYAKQKLEEVFKEIKKEVSTDIPESSDSKWDEGYEAGVYDSLHIIGIVERKTIKEL